MRCRKAGRGSCVADRGPGVPEAERERIFEPFYRLPGHAGGRDGVGLGLALVRQIAHRHGGDVRCVAREGGGSRFEVDLPGLRNSEPRSAQGWCTSEPSQCSLLTPRRARPGTPTRTAGSLPPAPSSRPDRCG